MDPILNDLWGDQAGTPQEVEFDAPYGLGTWPDAVLMDVQTVENHEYGYRLALVLNLKGEEGMKFTGRINLPRTIEENGDPDRYDRAVKGNEKTRNNVAGLLLGADLLGGRVFDVNDDAAYEKMTNIFRHGVGKNMAVKVVEQRRFNQESQEWEGTGFTEIHFIKPRKRGKGA